MTFRLRLPIYRTTDSGGGDGFLVGEDFLGGAGGGERPLLVAATGLLFFLEGFRSLELSLAEPEEKDLDLDLDLDLEREPDVEEEADPENEEDAEFDPDGDTAARPRAGFAMVYLL